MGPERQEYFGHHYNQMFFSLQNRTQNTNVIYHFWMYMYMNSEFTYMKLNSPDKWSYYQLFLFRHHLKSFWRHFLFFIYTTDFFISACILNNFLISSFQFIIFSLTSWLNHALTFHFNENILSFLKFYVVIFEWLLVFYLCIGILPISICILFFHGCPRAKKMHT